MLAQIYNQTYVIDLELNNDKFQAFDSVTDSVTFTEEQVMILQS